LSAFLVIGVTACGGGPVIGRLPRALRVSVATVWIHQGFQAFGGGNSILLILVGQGDRTCCRFSEGSSAQSSGGFEHLLGNVHVDEELPNYPFINVVRDAEGDLASTYVAVIVVAHPAEALG
jgi:hypothetical protein